MADYDGTLMGWADQWRRSFRVATAAGAVYPRQVVCFRATAAVLAHGMIVAMGWRLAVNPSPTLLWSVGYWRG